jgi:hypothetical protein
MNKTVENNKPIVLNETLSEDSLITENIDEKDFIPLEDSYRRCIEIIKDVYGVE